MSIAPRIIRVLLVEDSADDAELLEVELKARGYQPQVLRLDTLADLSRELDRNCWDVILADYKLASFTALDALDTLKRSGRDIPCIIVSGIVGEETAVEAMKAGAHDFFLKGRLMRLGLAIEREIREAKIRRELQAIEGRKGAMLASAFDGVIAMDGNSQIIDFNPAAEKMFGHAAGDVVGKDMADLLIPAHLRDKHRQGLKRFLETGEGRAIGKVVEMPALHADGHEFPVELAISMVKGQQPPVFVGYVRDISARRRAEAEREQLLGDLRQAVQARDEFLSIASHELRTPLTPLELQIMAARQLLESGVAASPALIEKLQGKIEAAVKQVDRLTQLVNTLLDVTRITSGRMTLARKTVDLAEIARRVVDRLQEVIVRSGSKVTFKDSPAVGEWDPERIEIVVSNLLSNAVKYGQGKPIDLIVEAEGNSGRIVVKDHGIGIGLEDQQRIFQRFERAVPVRHYGGFGLGLWVSRVVVEAHGGTIKLTSEMGVGSTFAIELPLTPPPTPTEQ